MRINGFFVELNVIFFYFPPLVVKYPIRFLIYIGCHSFMTVPKVLRMVIVVLFGFHHNQQTRKKLPSPHKSNKITKTQNPCKNFNAKNSLLHNNIKSKVETLCHFCIHKIMACFIAPLFPPQNPPLSNMVMLTQPSDTM